MTATLLQSRRWWNLRLIPWLAGHLTQAGDLLACHPPGIGMRQQSGPRAA